MLVYSGFVKGLVKESLRFLLRRQRSEQYFTDAQLLRHFFRQFIGLLQCRHNLKSLFLGLVFTCFFDIWLGVALNG